MPHPFLLRYLPAMALWAAVIAAFTPFANVYLSKNLHVPMTHIGLIFSVAQVVQFCVGLLTPVLFRRLGMVPGIVATQIATAVSLDAWRQRTTSGGNRVLPWLLCVAVDERSGAVQPADEQGPGRRTQHGGFGCIVLQRRGRVGSDGGSGNSVCSIWISACVDGHRWNGLCGSDAVSGCWWGQWIAASQFSQSARPVSLREIEVEG